MAEADAPARSPFPRLGVSAGIWHRGRVLLVRRGRPPWQGAWSFPGGHVEPGELLAEAARREAREEAGLAIETVGAPLLNEVIRRDDGGAVLSHHVIAVFAARLSGPAAAVAGDDAAEAAWFAPDDVAALETTPALASFIAATAARLDADDGGAIGRDGALDGA